MGSFYENLVKKLGEAGAREHMREIRSKRKIHNGGGFNNIEVARRANAISLNKRWSGAKKSKTGSKDATQS